MDEERKALWKETYGKKAETATARHAAEEADDVVREWDKRNMFSDQREQPLAICPKVDTHCHIKMVSSDPDAALAWPGLDAKFNDFNYGTITGGSFNADTKSVTFDVISFYSHPGVGVTWDVKFKHLGEPRSFSMTVVD